MAFNKKGKDQLDDFDIDSGFEAYSSYEERLDAAEELSKKEAKAAAREAKAKAKQSQDKGQKGTKPSKAGGAKRQKEEGSNGKASAGPWKVISVLLVIIPLLLIILTLALQVGPFKGGIQAVGPTVLEGLTISQIDGMQLSVANKSLKDVSGNTTWTINDNPKATDSKSITLKVGDITWGDNIIKAVNGEETITYILKLYKAIDTKDRLHNQLSMLLDYPDASFKQSLVYNQASIEEIDQVVRDNYDVMVYDNGTVKTKQVYEGAILETTESKAYSLRLNKPLQLSNQFYGDFGVEVSGTFDGVEEATLTFDLSEVGTREVVVYKVVGYDFQVLEEGDWYYYNGNIVIKVTSPGVYIVKPKVDGVDYSELYNLYTIYVIKPDPHLSSAYNPIEPSGAGTAGTTEPEGAGAEPAEPMEPVPEVSQAPTEVVEPSIAPSEATEPIETTEPNGEVEPTDQPIMTQEAPGLNMSYYVTSVDKLLAKVLNSSDIPLQSKMITYEGGIEDTYLDIVSATNYPGEIASISSTGLSDTLTRGIKGERRVNYYTRNALIMVDLSNLDFDTCQYVAKTLSDLVTKQSTYDFNIVFMGASVSGISALADFSSNNVKIYETTSFNFTNAMVDSLTSNLQTASKSIQVDGESQNVVTVADSRFSFGVNNCVLPVSFNKELQAGDSYGQVLLTKLAYSGLFESAMVDGKGILYSNEVILPNTSIETGRTGVLPSEKTIDKINSGILAELSDLEELDIKKIIHELSISQMNSLADSLLPPSGTATSWIESMSNSLSDMKPIQMVIRSDLGSQSVLLTKISQSIDNPSRYFLHLYDPISHDSERIAILDTGLGVNEGGNQVGSVYNFSYTNSVNTFDRVYIVETIKLYNGEEWVYTETWKK